MTRFNRTQVRSITGPRNLRIWFENNEGFRGELILRTFRTLEKRPLRCLETSETDYPVTRHHIPKEWNPQLHCCENLRTFTEPHSTPQKFPAAYIYIKVKWSRYRPGVAQRVGRGIALLFHDRGTRRGWVVSSTPRPHFTPGKEPVPILQEDGWAPGPVWTGGKSRPHRDSIPDRPAPSQSIYIYIYIYIYIIRAIYIYTYIHIHIYWKLSTLWVTQSIQVLRVIIRIDRHYFPIEHTNERYTVFSLRYELNL